MLLTHRFLPQVWITLLKFRFPCLITYSTFPLRYLTGIRNLWYPNPNTWAPPDTCSSYSIPYINKWHLLHSAVQMKMQNFLWCLFLSHPTIEAIISVRFILNMYLDSIYSHHIVQVTIAPRLAYLNSLYWVSMLPLLYSLPLSKQNDLLGQGQVMSFLYRKPYKCLLISSKL